MLQADVLVIGSGGAGMYAAITAARDGASGAPRRQEPGRPRRRHDHGADDGRRPRSAMKSRTTGTLHLDDTLEAGRGSVRRALSRLLCEQGPAASAKWTSGGSAGRARDGHIKQVTAPGHRRKRCCYVDFLNTGPAVPTTLRPRCSASTECSRRRAMSPRPSSPCATASASGRGGARSVHRRAMTIAAKAVDLAAGGLTRIFRAQQRLDQHGRRGYALALARGRRARRHGVRAVLSDRPPRAAAGRHGPHHVGPVPLQARRPAAQRQHRGVHSSLRQARTTAYTAAARPGDLRHSQGSRGRTRLAARRRVLSSAISARRASRARSVR